MQGRVSPNLRRLIAGLMLLTASTAHGAVTCRFSSVQNLNFGIYDPFSAIPHDGATVLQVGCSSDNNRKGGEAFGFSVTLSPGAGSYKQRLLRDPLGNSLDYNLYLNAARTQVFGNGTGGTSFIFRSGSVTRTEQIYTFDIYGRIPAGQDPSVGSYSDTLIYTINY